MAVQRALMRLPVEQRAAVVAVDMQGYSVADTARLLGVAEGTVKSRCARARVRLAELLGYLNAGAAARTVRPASTPRVGAMTDTGADERSEPAEGDRPAADRRTCSPTCRRACSTTRPRRGCAASPRRPDAAADAGGVESGPRRRRRAGRRPGLRSRRAPAVDGGIPPALRAAAPVPPTRCTAGDSPARRRRRSRRPGLTAAAAAAWLCVCALITAPAPMPSSPPLEHITVSTPPMAIPLSQQQILGLLHRAPTTERSATRPARLLPHRPRLSGVHAGPGCTPGRDQRPPRRRSGDTRRRARNLAVFAVAPNCSAAKPAVGQHPGPPALMFAGTAAPTLAFKCIQVKNSKGSHDLDRHRSRRDRHGLRSCWVYRGVVCRPGAAGAGGVRGDVVRWRVDDDHRGGEFPGFSRRDHGSGVDGPDAGAGVALRCGPANGRRRVGLAGRAGQVGHHHRRRDVAGPGGDLGHGRRGALFAGAR